MNEDVGQQWSPPNELILPTPRPIRRVSWLAAARQTGNKLDLFGAAFLIFVLFALPFVFWGHKIDIDKLPTAIVIILGAFAFGGFLGAPVLLIGFLIILLISYFAVRKAKWLLKWGKPARAVVTGVGYVSGSSGLSVSFGTWVSTLEYHDDSGNIGEGKVKHRLSRDQVLTVLYDPDKPKKFIDYPVAGYEVGGG